MPFLFLVRKKLLHIIGALALGALLGGCGNATRLVYGQADDLLYWWVDGYVDLADAQSPRLRDDIAAALLWHRASQLPAYADLLAKLQPIARQEITPAQACAHADEIRAKLLAILAQVEPAAAVLAGSLSPAQLDHMQRKYEKSNEEFDRAWRKPPPDERRKKRIAQLRQRFEMFYGKPEAAQMVALTATIDESRYDVEAQHSERLRRQQDTLQTLRRIATDKPAAAEIKALVHGLIERSFQSPNPSYKARADALWRESCASFARVHHTTTSAQRAKAVEVLKGYEGDFRALAGKR